MHHVKSEHEKDDDDDDLTDDDRKPDGLLGPHHPGLSHHHPAYHTMLGGYHHGIKEEMNLISGSKNQTSSDCGIPIPATKPKIWSLADTAACKTPPPIHQHHGAWMTSGQGGVENTAGAGTGTYHTTHPNQHQVGLTSGMMMGGGGVGTQGHHINMMNTNPHHQHQSMTGMSSGMVNPHQFGNSPYSRYGGFLTGPHHYQSTMGPQNQQHQHQQQQQHQQQNHHPQQQQTQHHQQQQSSQNTPPTPNLNTSNNSQSMGFPEVQTDTPPQTPPNMKLPSVAANLLITTSSNPNTPANTTAGTPPNPTTGTCNYNNNNNNAATANNNLNGTNGANVMNGGGNVGSNGYIHPNGNNTSASSSPNSFMGNYTSLQQHSPQKIAQEYLMNGQHHTDSNGFKPFYKR